MKRTGERSAVLRRDEGSNPSGHPPSAQKQMRQLFSEVPKDQSGPLSLRKENSQLINLSGKKKYEMIHLKSE